MLTTKTEERGQYEMICIEELVPENHILNIMQNHMILKTARKHLHRYMRNGANRNSILFQNQTPKHTALLLFHAQLFTIVLLRICV